MGGADFSSACAVLTLVADRQDGHPRPSSQRQQLQLFLSSVDFIISTWL